MCDLVVGFTVEAKVGTVHLVEERIAKACKAFGALWEPIFRDINLSLRTMRKMYKAVVLGVLLYGSETWTRTETSPPSVLLLLRSSSL